MDITLRRFCKLYTIVLIVFIVEATSSNSNDTSPERRQSRVTGRIVKLYSGTRPEPILCAGEGFQADPKDCAVFYRCMKSGSGKYTVFRFQCGPGTVYDPETEVCNHPRSTKRSECGGLSPPPVVDRIDNNEIEGTQNEIPSPITIKPIRVESTTGARATFTTANPWTASSSTVLAHTSTKRHAPEVSTVFTSPFPWGSMLGHTNVDYSVNPLNLPQNTVSSHQQYTMVSKTTSPPTTSAIPKSNSRDNICTSNGFMGDSENCRKFYRCVSNQRGSYTRFEFSCSESTVWDDDTQSCNHAWAVKRSRCGRSNQDSQFTTNAEIPQKDSSTDKTIQQQLQVSFGSKVTQTQAQISNGSVIQNQTQINYGDRLNQNKDTKAKQNQTQISHGSAVSQTQTQIDYSDKGVQTQLQIDHSQQASQMQIQIHESTTPRPSPSAATSTTHSGAQGGNNCERSGFMGDKNDCKKFYRCIDNGRGGYTKFEFSCGEGTVWDQSIEACNHAWAVKDCGGKGTTQAAISTSQSTQNYYTTASTEIHHTTSELIDTEDNEDSGYGHQNQNPTTSSSTTLSSTTWSSTTVGSTTTTKSPSNGNCQSSGFIGDENDCKIFYRCVENGKGGFTKYEFKCGEGTVWDPDLEACNHAWAVKRCGGNATPDISNIETTTEQQNTVSTAHTQSTILTQSPIESAATQNDDYDTGYGPGNNDFTTSTTTTTKKPQNQEPSVGTVCTSSGFMGDENDCKKFYRCVDNGNGGYTRYEFSCGEGTVWDSKIEACNHAWAVEKCGGSAVDHQEATTQAKPTTTHEVIDSSSTEGDVSTSSSTLQPSSTPSISATESVTSVSMSGTDCTKSGFMGDQKDCKKFYRCVDNGKGSFTKYEFSCGEGTVWDQKIEACNHAWAVEKCGGTADSSTTHHETTTPYHPTMSDEIDNGYPSNIDTGSDITTQSSTTLSTTESSKEPSEGNNCVNSGFIGDKNDCKKFYRCVDDGNGKYIRYEFTCGEGTLWDQSIEACNHAWAVKDCGNTGAHPSSERPAQSTLTTESEDQGYPQSTEMTSTSTVSSYPDSGTSEACSKEGFMGDKKNCKKFYRCVDNGQGGFTKYEFTCGEGTYWSQEILACDHATPDKTCGGNESGSSTQTSHPEHDEIYTEATSMSSSATIGNENEHQTQQPPASSGMCLSEGFYGDPNDCKKFYRCVDNGKGGYTKYDFACGDGTVWDQEIQACNHESSNKKCSTGSPPISQTTEKQPDVGNDISMTTTSQIQHSTEKTETSSTSTSSSNECSSEGFFGVPNDCKKFIRCVSNDKGGYTIYEFTCGEGTIWVQDMLACDHDTGDTNCSSQTTSKPLTTVGHPQPTENNEVGTSTSEPQTIDKQEDEYDNGNFDKPSQPGSGVCSSEGFYGNENDCKQFYRCVDNGQGGFTKYDFTCGEGTAWDSEIQACNHIDQVETCHGGSGTQPVMHDEDNSPSAESSSTVSSSTTSSGTTSSGTTASGSTASGTTAPSTTSSSTATSGSNQGTNSGNTDKCDSEGYFGNSQDCKKFYRCVDNGKGGYTKYDFDCGDGTIWDQDVTTCNHPQDVVNPSCNQNQDGSTTSTTAASSSSSSESSSTTESSSSGDPSSSTSSTSSSSQSTTESTQGSSNCSQADTSKKPANQNITCEKAGYYANPNDCKKFYRCVDWDGDGKRFSVYHFDCGEGTIWDPAVETCNHEESVYPPRDCSGSQSQSENQPPATEGTTTTQQEMTSSQDSSSTQTTSTTQSSTEQTTQSTTSEPATTQQSTSTEKTTTQQSTTSDQTTTQKSSTTEQTTQQSTTSEQTTQSTTSEQTTQQPSSSEQTTTQQSTTSEQTTQSTTSEQTTQQPSSSEQTTTQQSTTSEQTTTQQSTTSEQTTTQQSTTSEQTTTQQSTTSEQTTTEQSTTSEQTTTEKSTTTEQTTTQQSTTSEQTTQEPATSEQTTQESTTSEQTTQASTTTEQSTTSEQTTTEQSTTESSTTEQSTTQRSTTTEQSEQSTTEETTSSEGTTTQQSTTQQSTTEQTTESTTTESGTDESTSGSKCPETDENQSLFVCPTSFKRHPKYCNLFYQCDEDDDTHDVKIAVFTCPNNTIYDESQTRCTEESKADKKCDGKIAQRRRFKRLYRDYKEPLVVTKESHACPSAGYFSFEKDSECSPAFLKCKHDKSNKLRGLVYQCPSGYVYWSISKRCEPMNRVRDCKRSQNDWTGRWEIPVERRNVAPS